MLDATELDAGVTAAILQEGPGTDEGRRATDQLLRRWSTPGRWPAGSPGHRWRPYDSVRMVARQAAQTLPEDKRLAAVRRAVAMYLARAKTLRVLLSSEAARLNPRLAALAQVEIDRQRATRTPLSSMLVMMSPQGLARYRRVQKS